MPVLKRKDENRLRILCEEATPGPWRVLAYLKKFEIQDRQFSEISNGKENRDFIAAARAALPEALETIERMDTVLRKLVEEIHGDGKRCPWCCKDSCAAEKLLKERE